MQIVVSLQNPEDIAEAERLGADLIELRLDLMTAEGLSRDRLLAARAPRILTLRSVMEGGRFGGSPADWFSAIAPLAAGADYVDVERRFSEHAAAIRDMGSRIVASCHRRDMPSPGELREIEESLRSYGDIPKIVVSPGSERDVLDLLSFTLSAEKPICTGVMGARYSFARAILPLFGSAWAYCHMGAPTASGQFHIREMRELASLLERR